MKNEIITKSVIYVNLRRTLKKGLLSSIDFDIFNFLATKYFGVYEGGKLVGYQCPYSGKILTDTNNIVLEHIIPVSLGGGTLLFNCIPTSPEINHGGEKSNKHLINWWINSKYWDKGAPQRLEKLVGYILEACEITLNYKDSEYNFFDDAFNSDSVCDMCDGNADLSTTQEEKQFVCNGQFLTYYTFINDLFDELKKYMGISMYKSRLCALNDKNFFGNIDRQTRVQAILKNIIKEKLRVEDRSELSIVLRINISLLTKSLETCLDDSSISFELSRRISVIEDILQKNGISLFSFFQNVESLNYLNFNDLSDSDIEKLTSITKRDFIDKFKALIDLAESYGKNSKMTKKDMNPKIKWYIYCIEHVKDDGFYISLSGIQLRYLHDSKNKFLNNIYRTILSKSIEKDIRIEYIALDVAENIVRKEIQKLFSSFYAGHFNFDLLNNVKKFISLDEHSVLSKFKNDVMFFEFVCFILKSKRLPDSNLKFEIDLSSFLKSITDLNFEKTNFLYPLTYEQLHLLSVYRGLNIIYKYIFAKAIENHFTIAYVNEKVGFEIINNMQMYRVSKSWLGDKVKLELNCSNIANLDKKNKTI